MKEQTGFKKLRAKYKKLIRRIEKEKQSLKDFELRQREIETGKPLLQFRAEKIKLKEK